MTFREREVLERYINWKPDVGQSRTLEASCSGCGSCSADACSACSAGGSCSSCGGCTNVSAPRPRR